MRVGLVIYGGLETVSGGYLYDRMLVRHLRARGDSVEIVSLPWRDYARHLGDNLSAALYRRLRDGAWDVLLQDELNHPSLVAVNRRLGAARLPDHLHRPPSALQRGAAEVAKPVLSLGRAALPGRGGCLRL